MSSIQLIAVIIAGVFVTPLTVLLIPRRRYSPFFDKLLWAGTAIVALIAGWLAVNYIAENYPSSPLNGIRLADVPVFTAFLGAAAGALILNAPLWVLDRFDKAEVEEDDAFKRLEEPMETPSVEETEMEEPPHLHPRT